MLMADFVTCVKYGLPVKVIVVNNDSLGQIKWEQMVFLGNPEYVCDLAPIDFAMVAHACGGTGFTIRRPENCGAILEEALAAPGPVIVNAIVDRSEEHTSELQSLMRISYAVFCLKKKTSMQ